MGRGKTPVAFLDTHVVVWLYDALTEKFSREIRELINESNILISPTVKLELAYLREIRRIRATPELILRELGNTLGLRITSPDFLAVIDVAATLSWTRDPFDRLITAEVMLEKAPLISADTTIMQHYEAVRW